MFFDLYQYYSICIALKKKEIGFTKPTSSKRLTIHYSHLLKITSLTLNFQRASWIKPKG